MVSEGPQTVSQGSQTLSTLLVTTWIFHKEKQPKVRTRSRHTSLDLDNVCYDDWKMIQMGSNPLFHDLIFYQLMQKTKDLTLFEPSFSHRNKHRPCLHITHQIVWNITFMLHYIMCYMQTCFNISLDKFSYWEGAQNLIKKILYLILLCTAV